VRRDPLTLIRIFEELRGRGYDGGYDTVCRYARRWAKQPGQATAAAYVPLSFVPRRKHFPFHSYLQLSEAHSGTGPSCGHHRACEIAEFRILACKNLWCAESSDGLPDQRVGRPVLDCNNWPRVALRLKPHRSVLQ
jgi:hypothetical protein